MRQPKAAIPRARAVNPFVRRSPRAVLKSYDVDHFGSFDSDRSAQIIADQVRWLSELEF